MSGGGRTAILHPTVFVAPGAVVLGDVRLEAGASVWFNTVIRGDSAPVVIGEQTNLQDNSVVHEDEGLPARIGARVTVGHRSIIHGCVIEDDCLIGMGSVVLSGAHIGAGSLVGAASLVRERQNIPPGSLVVGSPARVIGPVSDDHRAAIRNGATHYAELARFYMMRGLARAADAGGSIARDHGPMTRSEWRELVERLSREPASNDDAAIDRDVRIPAIEAALRGSDLPVLGAGDLRAAGAPGEAGWRRALCERLMPLGPEEWARPIGHPTRGAQPLSEWVREWAESGRAPAPRGANPP